MSSVKIIYDMRGAAGAEYLDSIGLTNESEISEVSQLRGYKRYLSSELKMVRLSDATFCVSQNLKQYALRHCPEISGASIYVVPGAADNSIFYYDKELGERTKASLNLIGKTSFVYCGSLEQFWHKSELMFKFVHSMIKEKPDIVFICLTRHLDIALSLQVSNDIPDDKFICKFVSSASEINAIYNAADFAILFRDDIETNRVASPTKLAEYLLAGLPVLITQGVGDYSQVVKNEKLGSVCSANISDLLSQSLKGFYKGIDRSYIHQFANGHFAKQAVVHQALIAYRKL